MSLSALNSAADAAEREPRPEDLAGAFDSAADAAEREPRTEDLVGAREAPKLHAFSSVSSLGKLPPFSASDPVFWIHRLDNYFACCGITDQVFKYRVTASEIPETVASELRDLLISKPAKDAYDKLRDAIITRLAESRTQRVRRLLGGEALGDRKPSQFLRHLQHLLGDELGSSEQDFLRELFLQRMPESIRLILSASGASVRLADLADMADRMLECSFPPVHVASKRHESAGDSAFSSDTHTNINFLLESVRRLEEQVSSLAKEFHQLKVSPSAGMTMQADRPSRPSDRLSTSRYARRSPSRPRTIINGLCYYHERFGDKAHTCYAGCKHFVPKVQPSC